MTSRLAFFGLLVGLALVAMAPAARAGEPIDSTVLLDPFDPVPEIQFHHLGDCYAGCGYAHHCYRGCGERSCHHVASRYEHGVSPWVIVACYSDGTAF